MRECPSTVDLHDRSPGMPRGASWNRRRDASGILFQRPARGKPSPSARPGVSCPLGRRTVPRGAVRSADNREERLVKSTNDIAAAQTTDDRGPCRDRGAGARRAVLDACGGRRAGRGRARQGAWSSRDGYSARNGRPLAGAAVEVWRANARGDAATATTDGDGRFFAKVASDRRGRPHRIHYRVSDGGRTLATQELYFARGRAVAERRSGHLQRDEAGTWRAAFGISLA